MKSIYELELHETTQFEKSTDHLVTVITRVAGGWIYSQYCVMGSVALGTTFVPYNNEYDADRINTGGPKTRPL